MIKEYKKEIHLRTKKWKFTLTRHLKRMPGSKKPPAVVSGFSWKKWVIYLVIAAMAIAIFYGGFRLYRYWNDLAQTPTQTRIIPKKNETIITIGVYGNLSVAQIQPSFVKVEKGEVVVFRPPQGMMIKGYGNNGAEITATNISEKIDLSDVICFTIPGKQGHYFLGSPDTPTALTLTKSGKIEFSLDYPTLSNRYYTIRALTGYKFVQGPVYLTVSTEKRLPVEHVSPRQFARLGFLAGVLFPNLTVEKEQRNFDLRKDAQKGFAVFEKSLNIKFENFKKFVHGGTK